MEYEKGIREKVSPKQFLEDSSQENSSVENKVEEESMASNNQHSAGDPEVIPIQCISNLMLSKIRQGVGHIHGLMVHSYRPYVGMPRQV